jgi:DNA-binding HxlR family transcriptional regulator
LEGTRTKNPRRAGAVGLSLLSAPINVPVLRALARQPMPLPELCGEVGSLPQTTVRNCLRSLAELGVVERRHRNGLGSDVVYSVAKSGHGLLTVASVLERWLATSPAGPTNLGTASTKGAVDALVHGWSTSIVRALAARPLSLIELDAILASVSYPSLARRLRAMQAAGLIEPLAPGRRSSAYRVSEWLRKASAPLIAAARWERRYLGRDAPAITGRDIEATFLLTLPLLRVSPETSGSCRLAVQVGGRNPGVLAGAIASVRDGAVESFGTRLKGQPSASAIGTTDAWFSAVLERDLAGLELIGDLSLASEVIDGLSGTLLASPVVGQPV